MSKRNSDLNFKYNIKEYLSIISAYSSGIFFLILGVFIVELTYIADKLVFKGLIDKATEFVAKNISQIQFIDFLLILIIFYFTFLSFRILGKWLKQEMLNRIDAHTPRLIREKYFLHIINLSYKFHTSHKTGSLISRLIRGSSAIERLNDTITFNILPLFVQIFVVTSTLFFFDWKSGIVVMLMSVIFFLYSMFLFEKQISRNVLVNTLVDIEKAYVSDFFTNINSIRYFGKEKYVDKKYKSQTKKVALAKLKFHQIFRDLEVGQSFILGMGTFFLILFPILGIINGTSTIGTLTFIYLAAGTLIRTLHRFVGGMRGFYRSIVDFDDLFGYGKLHNEIVESPGAKKLKVSKAHINFSNIIFNYNDQKLFKNFSLDIKPNTKVALVGHSGSGKTSLVRLLFRLFDIKSGTITIDNQDISKVTKQSLRNSLSIVPQECMLFDDTIYNNVAFSRKSATKNEVLKAIKLARLDEVIANFPLKDKTIVGERGVRLSGGEKQRVSIARALLANKKILVLDEATSALDSKTEHGIQQDLLKLMRGRTTIIIAHRLSTIMSADKIIVMDRGRIVQQGTHNELIKKKGHYQELWNLQKGGYIE